MATIKENATLLDMVIVPEQQEHLKGFIEGKITVVANLITEEEDESFSDNKVLVVTHCNLIHNLHRILPSMCL
jgi:hypothetical protein